MAIKATILYTEGCTGTPPTIDLVKGISSEMGLDVDLELIQVKDQRQAEDLKFLGSPTVQVNGVDIEPSARNSRTYGFM